MDTFKSIVHTVEHSVGDVVKQVNKEINHGISESTGFAVDAVEKSLKHVGVYHQLDNLYKKYGKPTFKFTKQYVDKIKTEFKHQFNKTGINLDDVIILMRAHPLLNKWISQADNADKLLNALAKGDMKEVAKIGVNIGITHYVGKILPTGKHMHLAQWAYKYKVYKKPEKYAKLLMDDINQSRGRHIDIKQARAMIQKTVDKVKF